jgi:hypothetical protein
LGAPQLVVDVMNGFGDAFPSLYSPGLKCLAIIYASATALVANAGNAPACQLAIRLLRQFGGDDDSLAEEVSVRKKERLCPCRLYSAPSPSPFAPLSRIISFLVFRFLLCSFRLTFLPLALGAGDDSELELLRGER